MKWLGDFYFDARYPGDNFVEVNKEDALECIRITEDLQQKVRNLLEQNQIERENKKAQIQSLDSFDL